MTRRVKRRLSGRVAPGHEVIKLSRVRSGRVKKFSNLAGRVESGQIFFKYDGPGRVGSEGFQKLARRVGSSRLTRPDPT